MTATELVLTRAADVRTGDPVEDELVRLARAGNADAFGQLVDRHRRALFRAAYAALGSEAEAEDAVQDACVAALRKVRTFRGDASFRTWLLSIAWRKALDRRRHLTRWMRLTVSRDERFEGAGDPADAVASSEPAPDDRLTDEELNRTIKRLVASLPRKMRDALLLAGSRDYTYEEIAAMLGAPTGTVKWRVSEARRVLQRKLAAMGYSHE